VTLSGYPLFPDVGESYTAIYRGGPLNDQYENRESVGRRLTEITLGEGEPAGTYVISDWDGNGRDGIWFYTWVETTA